MATLKKMNRHGAAAGLLFGAMFLLFPRGISAEDAIRNLSVSRKAEDQAICLALRTTIIKGADALVVTKTALELGHNPCFVVKCALLGGGNLGKIITAAVQGGVPSDVISRCAADAGADLDDLAAIFAREELGLNICYFPPGEVPVRGGSASQLALPVFSESWEERPSTGAYSPHTF